MVFIISKILSGSLSQLPETCTLLNSKVLSGCTKIAVSNELSMYHLSLTHCDSLSELPETFRIGIKLKLRKIKTEKLKMIVRVVIIKTLTENHILFYSILYENVFSTLVAPSVNC